MCIRFFIHNLSLLALAFSPVPVGAQAPKSIEECIRNFEVLRGALRGSPTAETQATKLLDIQAIKERVEFGRLTDVRELERADATGRWYYKAFSAKLDGQKVFAKVSHLKPGEARVGPRKAGHIRNEAAWVKRLSELGIGPKFHGLSSYEDRYTIVTEFIEGIHFDRQVAIVSPEFKPTKQLLESLENIQRTLEREGVVSTDLQLRISPTRAWVIDPELFAPAKGQGEIYNSQADLRNLIEYVRMMVED